MFQIQPLPADQFSHLAALSDNELAERNVQIHISDGAFPCRVSLQDVPEGKKVYLLNYEHLPVQSPYRSRHAIFVAEGAKTSSPEPDNVPVSIASRLLSVRAFNSSDEIIDADVIDGSEVDSLIKTYFADPDVDYIHLHYARRGCFAAKVVRSPWS